VQENTRRKAAGEFEVRRPRTTKEIAVHNNQLLQELPGQMMQAMLQAQQGQRLPAAAWSEALREEPAAPRPTAEEQEAQAEVQQEQLLQRMAELEEDGAGENAPGLQGWGSARSSNRSYRQACQRLLLATA
jgi:DNA-binding transcriptional MerR regulator